MGTLLYAPAVKILIATKRNGILDVSDDLINGSMNMAEDQMSSLNFTLNNARRKYDGVFTPNDRVVVRMKRVAWVQVFSGYLNSVPFKSVFPRQVPLTASCTLKRLMYRYWDPGAPESVRLLDIGGNGIGFQSSTDGGIRDRLMRLLTEVAEWPKNAIHVGAIPGIWLDRVANLQSALASRVIVDVDSLGGDATTGGSSLTELGTTKMSSGDVPFAGVLPATSGKISWFGGPQGGAYGNMALTGESGVNPRDPWYCAMRWPYMGYVNGRLTPFGSGRDRSQAISWWKNRKILVVHPATNKAVVLRAADWGPGGVKSADARVIDVSKKALEVLGATTDSRVEIRFADPALPLGEITGKGIVLRREDPLGEDHPIVGETTVRAERDASGVRFAAADGLQPHVAAARQFIRGAWAESAPGRNTIGGYAKRNVRGTGTPSDHSFGLALDVMNGAKSIAGRTPQQLAHGTSVAQWFISNPHAFGTKYVIWNNKINTGSGWKTYQNNRWANDLTQGHYDHPHISFLSRAQGAPTKLGPMGGAWPGADMAGFPGRNGSGPSGNPTDGGGDPNAGPNLINSYLWTNRVSEAGQILSGIRALMNDTPILNSIQGLANASMRSFMAGPNGDFIAWFPDYFGTYKTAGRMFIKDIELAGDGFTITWDDSRLKTHMYVTGSWEGHQGSVSSPGGPVDLMMQFNTAGIATVEYPEIMEALFNVSKSDPRAKEFIDSETILQRYGARPEVLNLGTISGPQAEFWAALHNFQRNWARQFSARVELTFMPEVYPGMLLYLESYGLQVYVTGVSHTFDFQSGFHTSVTVVAPSATDGSGLFGLPRAEGV